MPKKSQSTILIMTVYIELSMQEMFENSQFNVVTLAGEFSTYMYSSLNEEIWETWVNLKCVISNPKNYEKETPSIRITS